MQRQQIGKRQTIFWQDKSITMQDHANLLLEVNDLWPGDLVFAKIDTESPAMVLTICYDGSDKLKYGVKHVDGVDSYYRFELLSEVEAEIRRITGK